MNALREECQQLRDELIALRREFHRDPELGLHEYHTAARIERELDRCGIPHERIGGKTAASPACAVRAAALVSACCARISTRFPSRRQTTCPTARKRRA